MGKLRRLKMFKGFKWLCFLLCVAFCIYSFIDKEYVVGAIFTILTLAGTINTVRSNLKSKKK